MSAFLSAPDLSKTTVVIPFVDSNNLPSRPNADFTMFVKLVGIVADISPLQQSTARFPMQVTLGGIVNDVNL